MIANHASALKDACLGSSDVALWKSSAGYAESRVDLFTCGKDSIGKVSQVKACVDREFPPYSTDCSQCFQNLILNTSNTCAGPCASNIFQDSLTASCIACVEKNANPHFKTCAGFAVDVCNDCAAATSDDSLDPLIIGGIAIGAVLLITVVFFLVKCMLTSPLTENEKRMRMENQISALGVKEIAVSSPKSENIVARIARDIEQPEQRSVQSGSITSMGSSSFGGSHVGGSRNGSFNEEQNPDF